LIEGAVMAKPSCSCGSPHSSRTVGPWLVRRSRKRKLPISRGQIWPMQRRDRLAAASPTPGAC